MKISEMTTKKAVDFLCIITPFVENIVTDENLIAELKKAIDPKKVKTIAERFAVMAKKITTLISIILKNHKNDIFNILAVLNEKTVEEIANQNILITAGQIEAVIKDEELTAFFKLRVNSEGNE